MGQSTASRHDPHDGEEIEIELASIELEQLSGESYVDRKDRDSGRDSYNR